MKIFPTLALAGLTLFSASAFAAAPSQRIRGAIQSFDQNSVTINTRGGGSTKLMLNDNTKFVYVVKSSMSKLDQGDYIGVATKQQSGRLVALEVSIFPKSMRGMGEGHYSWDRLRDTTQTGGGMKSSAMTNGTISKTSGSNGSMMTQSAMTNGTVSKKSGSSGSMMTQSAMTNGTVSHMSNNGDMTQSAMTNGSVASTGNKKMGGQQITVNYNGKQKHVWVPSSARIVRFQPASHSALKKGAKVFIMATKNNGKLTAKLVAVGKNGLNPPM